MANEFYDRKEEYYKRVKRLIHNDYHGDWGDYDRCKDLEWIRDYEETESCNGMGS